jgi:hypothetical protein
MRTGGQDNVESEGCPYIDHEDIPGGIQTGGADDGSEAVATKTFRLIASRQRDGGIGIETAYLTRHPTFEEAVKGCFPADNRRYQRPFRVVTGGKSGGVVGVVLTDRIPAGGGFDEATVIGEDGGFRTGVALVYYEGGRFGAVFFHPFTIRRL